MAKTKNTHAFQSDIKHYDKIRDILRYLYMFGSSSKEELVEKKLSKSISSFYDTKQRIENYIDGEYLQEHRSSEKRAGKKYRFMYDPFVCPVNYLAETFQNCSYVIDDFIFYFCLMQAFTDPQYHQLPYEYAPTDYSVIDDCMDYNHEFTISELITTLQIIFDTNQELLEYLNDIPGNAEHSELLFTLPKVRARISELKDIGIIVNTKAGNYCLAKDIFSSLNADELQDIQLMTQFYYNCSFLTIPGYYLSATIDEYATANFVSEKDSFFNKQENPVFFYKNQRLQNVIDDDVTWSILLAIHKTHAIRYKYRTRNGTLKIFTSLPMKLVIDHQYGRQYFFGYDYDYKDYNMYRLSNISDIKTINRVNLNEHVKAIDNQLTTAEIHKQYQKMYSQYIDKVWNIAMGESVTDILIHFHFSSDSYSKQMSRLKTSRRHGNIKELGNDNVDYTISVKDELELIPWIRSFGASAVVDKDQNPTLSNRMKEDWKEALKQYGTVLQV